MLKQMRDVGQKRRGFVMAGDWVFVATILVLGAVTGLVTIRQTRLPELAAAVKTTTPALSAVPGK
jgi:hypothetical protein